jgi:hypothetical protein
LHRKIFVEDGQCQHIVSVWRVIYKKYVGLYTKGQVNSGKLLRHFNLFSTLSSPLPSITMPQSFLSPSPYSPQYMRKRQINITSGYL